MATISGVWILNSPTASKLNKSYSVNVTVNSTYYGVVECAGLYFNSSVIGGRKPNSNYDYSYTLGAGAGGYGYTVYASTWDFGAAQTVDDELYEWFCANSTPPEPEITGISIDPTEAFIARGETCQFTATVEGDEGCSQEVAFALSGNNGTSETTISETGLLEVGADETSETFSVIVYAVDNPDITATATVTVAVPDLRPVYKKTGGKWVKKTAYQMTNGEWVLISTASK